MHEKSRGLNKFNKLSKSHCHIHLNFLATFLFFFQWFFFFVNKWAFFFFWHFLVVSLAFLLLIQVWIRFFWFELSSSRYYLNSIQYYSNHTLYRIIIYYYNDPIYLYFKCVFYIIRRKGNPKNLSEKHKYSQ